MVLDAPAFTKKEFKASAIFLSPVIVLIRFRENPVALACDIKEMYLRSKRKTVLCFRWGNCEGDRDPGVLEFNRMVFGKNAAPIQCQFVAQGNARRNQSSYPMIAETVWKSTYMDDSMDCVETEEDGIELYRKLEELWSLAGMQARKWVSKSPKVIVPTPEEHHATKVSLSDNQDPVIKALRFSWESNKDVLSVLTADVPPDLPLRKRSVLEKIAAVFDPLCFVSPFLATAKILLQRILGTRL